MRIKVPKVKRRTKIIAVEVPIRILELLDLELSNDVEGRTVTVVIREVVNDIAEVVNTRDCDPGMEGSEASVGAVVVVV